MSSNISSKATIAKNTTLLYARTALILIVTLYTSRVILEALGVKDYGVYTAIGGVVSILSVVIGPIDSAISRFLTFELGRNNKERLNRYFSTGLTIMILFSLLSVVILETLGLWFLNNKMVLDESRILAANWVLHLTIATFVVNIISSPYRAAIIAHEKMSLFAYMGILDAVLRLIVAFAIKFSSFDKLILYAILLLIIAFFIRFVYTIICSKKFDECKAARLSLDKKLFGEVFSFAGWNLFGAVSLVCRNQGINILFNLFGGPLVNAAYGIATQVNGAVGNFVNNFTTALNPSIIKSYASSQKEYMLSLVYQGAKYSYFLVLLFALPLLLETEYVTHIWLGQTPVFSVPFIRLMLLHSLIESLSKTLMAGTQASGKIKTYQIIVGLFQILILPLSYALLRFGLSPTAALAGSLIIDVVALFIRIVMTKRIFDLSAQAFIKNVLLISIIVTIAALIPPAFLKDILGETLINFLIICIVSFLSTTISILYIGCSKTERSSIINNVVECKRKIK